MSNRTKGLLFAFIALFSWGIHGPAGRYLALQGVDMMFVTEARFVIGMVVFGLFLLIKRAFVFDIKRRFGLVLFIALVGVCGNSLVYHLTLKYLSGTLVMILENLAPVFVFLLSFIVHKIKPKMIEFLTLIIAMSGIVLIVLGKEHFEGMSEGFYIGVILGVLTGLTFGLYVFFSSELMRPLKGDPVAIVQFLFKIFVICSLCMSPFLFTATEYPSTTREWLWLLEMGVFQSGLSYLFWNYALTLLPVNMTSVLFISTIIFTTINEVLFLGLTLNPYLIAGGALIVLAGYLLAKKDT